MISALHQAVDGPLTEETAEAVGARMYPVMALPAVVTTTVPAAAPVVTMVADKVGG